MYLHIRALSGQHSDPCALSALEAFLRDFSALGLVSSRGLRPAIALGREGLARVRVRPRRGRRATLARCQGRVSAVSHTRPNHSLVFLQRPVCCGPPIVPWSRSFFLSLSGCRRSWSRCCGCFCQLLLLPTTSVLKWREMLGTSIAAVFLAVSIYVL